MNSHLLKPPTLALYFTSLPHGYMVIPTWLVVLLLTYNEMIYFVSNQSFMMILCIICYFTPPDLMTMN